MLRSNLILPPLSWKSMSLSADNKLMDVVGIKHQKLVEKTTKLKTMKHENTMFRHCVSDVRDQLQKILTTPDAVLTPSVRSHLQVKLAPSLAVLDCILRFSVSGSGSTPKQGGEEDDREPTDREPTPFDGGNADAPTGSNVGGASGSGTNTTAQEKAKGKKPVFGSEDKKDEELQKEQERLEREEREKHDRDLDELNALRKRLDKEDLIKEQEMTTKESLMLIFPPWTFETLKNALQNQAVNWLEPTVHFDVRNHVDMQLDFPMTPTAFLYRSFFTVKDISPKDQATNVRLCKWYLCNARPRHECWNAKKIIGVRPMRVIAPTNKEDFTNVVLQLRRGDEKIVEDITLADFPSMNPFDWISMLHILARDSEKVGYLLDHVSMMIKGYLGELSKLDVEIAGVMKAEFTYVMKKQPKSFAGIKPGVIKKKDWSVAFVKESVKKGQKIMAMFYLTDKHGYSTKLLEYIVDLVEKVKENDENDKKCFVEMIKWYLVFRSQMLDIVKPVFRVKPSTGPPQE